MRGYVIIKKWNYDPRSTTRSRKALGILDHAKDQLLRTGLMDYPGNFIDMTLETRAAWTILDNAGKAVAHDDDSAQSAARQIDLKERNS